MRIMETKVYKFNELSDTASDESIIETIKMNDYEFTEEGKLIWKDITKKRSY